MKERLIMVLSEFNDEIISYEGDNLFEAGLLDSLGVIDIVGRLEDEFDVEIDAEYVIEKNFKTVDAILELLNSIVR